MDFILFSPRDSYAQGLNILGDDVYILFLTLTFHKLSLGYPAHKAVLNCREDTLSIYHSRTLRLLLDGRKMRI